MRHRIYNIACDQCGRKPVVGKCEDCKQNLCREHADNMCSEVRR